MQCSELGLFWTKEFTLELQMRRDAAAEMAGRCKSDGDYRKQIEMAVLQMDTALAAPYLLAALEGVLRVADRATDEFDAARAAILKATGIAS